MPKRKGFERSRQELSLDVAVGVHILLVVEQSRLESQSRRCVKTPILTVHPVNKEMPTAPRSYFDVLSLSGVRVLFSFLIFAWCTSVYLCVATSCANENTCMQCLQRSKVWMIQQTNGWQHRRGYSLRENAMT